jgi:hypothetical protein
MTKVLVAAAVAAALALPAGEARADFNIGYYTHDTCVNWSDPNTRVDPINFVFFQWGTIARVENQLYTHAGANGYYWYNHEGTLQYFISHSSCNAQYYQYADNNVGSSREHFREYPIHSAGEPLGYTMITDAHHDHLVWCGGPSHAVDPPGWQPGIGNGGGFDYGQWMVYRMFYAQTNHSTYQIYFGNTQQMRQCNGWIAWDNGYAQMMQAHQVNH